MGIDGSQFRRVLSHFCTGVAVVTVRHPGGVHGMTANALASVSLDPPLVLVCVGRHARTHRLLPETGSFAVNLLAEDQLELAERFAGRRPELEDPFAGVVWHPRVSGAPIIDGCLGFVDCRLHASHPGGDHSIFVGEVVDLGVPNPGPDDPDRPLLFYRGRYRSLGSQPASRRE